MIAMKSIVLIVIVLSVFHSTDAKSQTDYIINFEPNPTKFVIENRDKFFSKEEYQQLKSHKTIGFETVIDTETKEITDLEYSQSSRNFNNTNGMPILSDSLASKTARILKENIKVSKLKYLGRRSTEPDTTLIMMIVDVTFEGKLPE